MRAHPDGPTGMECVQERAEQALVADPDVVRRSSDFDEKHVLRCVDANPMHLAGG